MIARVWTDGGCKQGAGGWAVYAEMPDGRSFSYSGFERGTTNNRMELQAVIEALLRLPASVPIKIISDSQYVVHGITNWVHGWKVKGWFTADGNPVANRDQWEHLLDLTLYRHIEWAWVKGHQNTLGNIIADRLASEARKRAEAP